MPSRPAILSISSMKTIPDSSTRRIASLVAASMSISRVASSCASASSASGTGMRVFFVFFGMMFWKRSRSPCSTSSMPCGVITSIMADAGRPDHDDVLGCDLLAERLGDVHATPAVPERDRDRALGGALADDVAVEFGDDLARGEVGHGQAPSISSMVRWSLV